MSDVLPLNQTSGAVRASFDAFANELAIEGFAFYSRMRKQGATGPVLTCQRDERIVGAIGPMEIMLDSNGATRLLPQYFVVLPEYRRLGLGRALWRAAMIWGEHGTAYQLLQTQIGGVSDSLCRQRVRGTGGTPTVLTACAGLPRPLKNDQRVPAVDRRDHHPNRKTTVRNLLLEAAKRSNDFEAFPASRRSRSPGALTANSSNKQAHTAISATGRVPPNIPTFSARLSAEDGLTNGSRVVLIRT